MWRAWMWKPQLPLIVNKEQIEKKGKQNNAYLFLSTDLREKNKKSKIDKKEAELYNHNRSKQNINKAI